MNRIISLAIVVGGVFFSTSGYAACEQVKDSIAQKIMQNGVPEGSFTLEFVAPEDLASASGKVVGQCGGNKIVYTRTNGSQPVSTKPAKTETKTTSSSSTSSNSTQTGTKPKASVKKVEVEESHEVQAVDAVELNLGADEAIVNQTEYDGFTPEVKPQSSSGSTKTSSKANSKSNVIIYP